ncbi:MAG: helix-turn-helix domain-containing protein [Alphaproteobacteria bacterium]|nr:helix-turn-helix domain-containing protein [Alphaproteobacteria bacterium]
MNNIKSIRKKLNISVTELSKRVGMSQANLTKIENNQVELKVELAQKIANSLNIPIEAILNNSSKSLNNIELINPEVYSLPQFSGLNIPCIENTQNSKGFILDDDTMYPLLPKYSIALIDTTKHTIENAVFLIKTNNLIKIRRLQITANDTLFVIPENKSYQTETLTIKDIEIIAKVTGVVSYQSI